MKKTVIPRHVDELGRVAVPAEFRRELKLSPEEDIRVYLSEPDEKGVFTLTAAPGQANTVIRHELGFLVIPQGILHEYGLNGSTLDIWIEDEVLRLKKTVPQCAVSGETENLIRWRDTDRYLSEKVVREMYGKLASK